MEMAPGSIAMLVIIILLVVVNVRRRRHIIRPENSPEANTPRKKSVVLSPELRLLANWLIEEASEKTGVSLKNDATAVERIEAATVVARKALASRPRHKISLPFLTSDASGPKHFELELTREHLKQFGLM